MRILCVTGCDARYFLTALAFLESLRAAMPDVDARVCDFGMSDGQRAMLRAEGLLLARPAALPADAHPYLCKGHLGGFVDREAWDAVLWLDCDMLPGALDRAAVHDLAAGLRHNGKAVAATATIDGLTIDGMLEELRRNGHHVEPAAALFERWAVDRARPYVSAGLLMFASRDLLARWAETCRAVAPHALWEQNVLNALAGRDPSLLHTLDPWLWQVYDAPLAEVAVPDPGRPGDLRLRGRRVMTVHASSRKGHHLDADLSLNVGDYVLRGPMRLFANPALQRIQMSHLAAAVTRRGRALIDAGTLVPRR